MLWSTVTIAEGEPIADSTTVMATVAIAEGASLIQVACNGVAYRLLTTYLYLVLTIVSNI